MCYLELKKDHEKQRMLILLLLVMFVRSFVSVFAKIAGQYEILSVQFCLYYGISLMIMAVYAIFWQIVLEKNSLTAAYMVKGLTSVYIYIWSVVFFGEQMSVNELIGAAFIILGVLISQR